MEHSEQQPAQQTLAQQPRLLETPRRVKASQGVEWISQAWKIYRRNKIKWPAIFLTFFFNFFIDAMAGAGADASKSVRWHTPITTRQYRL